MTPQIDNPEFWTRIDAHMSRAAELAVRSEEVGQRKRELIAQLQQEISEREAAQRMGINWHWLRLGLPTTTSGGGAARPMVVKAPGGGAPRRRRRWLWR